jgi:hypothetical protein
MESAVNQPEKKVVHMTCRVKHPITGDSNCEGTEATIVSTRRAQSQVASGGTHYASYTCTTCGGSWTIGF